MIQLIDDMRRALGRRILRPELKRIKRYADYSEGYIERIPKLIEEMPKEAETLHRLADINQQRLHAFRIVLDEILEYKHGS